MTEEEDNVDFSDNAQYKAWLEDKISTAKQRLQMLHGNVQDYRNADRSIRTLVYDSTMIYEALRTSEIVDAEILDAEKVKLQLIQVGAFVLCDWMMELICEWEGNGDDPD